MPPRVFFRLYPSHSLVLTPGQTVSMEVHVYSPDTFNVEGDTVISAFDLPEGVSAAPLTVAGGSSGVLTLTVALDAAPIEYTVATIEARHDEQVTTLPIDLRIVPELQRGMVDHSFGIGGVVGSPLHTAVAGLVLQSDGKFLIASQLDGEEHDLAIVRFDADGSIDPSYGEDGFAFADRPASVETGLRLRGLRAQPGGTLVMFATSEIDSRPVGLLYRFADNGAVVAPLSFDHVLGMDWHGMALDSQGRIVLIGGGISQAVVARFNADGSPDPTFGDDGVVIDTTTGLPDGWTGIAMLGDDAIVTGSGYSLEPSPYVAKVSASQPQLTVAIAEEYGAARVVIDDAGRIVVGHGWTNIARLDANLVIDSTFGDPWAPIDGAGSTTALLPLPGGDVFIGGMNSDVIATLAHLDADGEVVPFGPVTSVLIPVLHAVSSMAVTTDGHLLVSGTNDNAGYDRAVVTRIVL